MNDQSRPKRPLQGEDATTEEQQVLPDAEPRGGAVVVMPVKSVEAAPDTAPTQVSEVAPSQLPTVEHQVPSSQLPTMEQAVPASQLPTMEQAVPASQLPTVEQAVPASQLPTVEHGGARPIPSTPEHDPGFGVADTVLAVKPIAGSSPSTPANSSGPGAPAAASPSHPSIPGAPPGPAEPAASAASAPPAPPPAEPVFPPSPFATAPSLAAMSAPPAQRPSQSASLGSATLGSNLPPAPDPKKGRVARIILTCLKRGAQAALVLAVLGVIAVVVVIRHYESNLPSVEQLKAGYEPPQVTRILARDGTLLANVFVERRTVVDFKQVPDHVKQAFLAAEDSEFYEHEGLDYLGMLRALWANLRAGRTRQGGSTITQQVVKNVLLDSERSYKRKIRETILARRLEQYLTKDEILTLYMNHCYLGHGRYGVEEASRYYFGKKVGEISIAEAALLAGIVPSPERYSPRRSPEKALQRRRYVLDQMLSNGFMTKAVYEHAVRQPLRIAPAVEAESELAPEIVQVVNEVLEQAVGERARRGGYTVHTSIDPRLQAAARRAVRENLDNYNQRNKLEAPFTLKERRLWNRKHEREIKAPRKYGIYVGEVVSANDEAMTLDVRVHGVLGRVDMKREQRFNPKHLPPSEFAKPGAALRVSVLADPKAAGDEPVPLRLELGPQSALVSIDVRTRQVRALVGSYEAIMGGLDRALNSKRQPGSSFKPIMYSYALHSRRFTPASVLEFPSKDPEQPPVRMSLRTGVAKSDNRVAQRVLEEVGAANVVEWARALGIESKLGATPSLALGAYEVTPLELANAYATFASGGEYAPVVFVTKITGPDGQEVRLPTDVPKRRVMPKDEAYLITSLLKSVVERGTGQRAQALRRPAAGKTGTTNDAKDTWFVGYSTDIVTAVWVGYDDALPLGGAESGARTALPAWVSFMKAAHEKRPATDFPRPPGIITAQIDPATGLLAYPDQEGAIEEEFLDGTAPEEVASPDAGVGDAGVGDAGVGDAGIENAQAGDAAGVKGPDPRPIEGTNTPEPNSPIALDPAPATPVVEPANTTTPIREAGAEPVLEPPPF